MVAGWIAISKDFFFTRGQMFQNCSCFIFSLGLFGNEVQDGSACNWRKSMCGSLNCFDTLEKGRTRAKFMRLCQISV